MGGPEATSSVKPRAGSEKQRKLGLRQQTPRLMGRRTVLTKAPGHSRHECLQSHDYVPAPLPSIAIKDAGSIVSKHRALGLFGKLRK